MATLITSLDAYLREHYREHLGVETGETEMLISVPTRFGALQHVKVSLEQSRYGSVSFLRLRSRACLARDYQSVIEALEANADDSWCGFALDDSAQPHVLDVAYNMPTRNIDPREFVLAINKVAACAAEIGQRTGDASLF